MISNFTLPVPENAEPEMTPDQTLLEPQQFDDFEIQDSPEDSGDASFGNAAASFDHLDVEETSDEVEPFATVEEAQDFDLSSPGDDYEADGYQNGNGYEAENGNGWMEADTGESAPSLELEIPRFEEEELPQKSGFPLLLLFLS